MDNINFKKVLDDGELFDQQTNYEDNFEKINQLVVPKITDLEANKVDKVEGKGLSTHDFDNTYKQKIDVDIPAQLNDIENDFNAQLAEKAYKFGDFLYFYDNYNEFKALTGGFSKGFDSHPLEEGITKTEKQFNCLQLLADQTGGVGGNASEISFATTEAIDLTDINTLYVDWENTGLSTSANNQSYFIAGSIKDGNHNSFSSRLVLSQSFARRLSALDVSSLQGEYYIRVHSRNAAFVKSEVKIYRVFGGV